MDIITGLTLTSSIVDLAKEIAPIITKARESPDIAMRVLFYLKATQASVSALSLERQRILTEVSKCDAGNADQVNALWTRLHVYLYEDHIRPHLYTSIRGLEECHAKITAEAKKIRWRKRDTEAAVQAFSTSLDILVSTLDNLTSNFFPGGSGMGINTLYPIYTLVDEVRRNKKYWYSKDSEQSDKTVKSDVLEEIQTTNEKLGELALRARLDSSQEDWIQKTGEVEALIVKLQLAFSVKVTQKKINGE